HTARAPPIPYTTLFRSGRAAALVLQRTHRPQSQDAMDGADPVVKGLAGPEFLGPNRQRVRYDGDGLLLSRNRQRLVGARSARERSEEHTSELQSLRHLV